MNNLETIWNLTNIEFSVEIIKLFFILMLTAYTIAKITNYKKDNELKHIFLKVLIFFIIDLIATKLKYDIDSYWSMLFIIFLLTLFYTIIFRKGIIYSLIIVIISFCINYVTYIISVMITFFPNVIFNINNDWIRLFLIITIYCIIIFNIFKMKKLKYGITFLKDKLEDINFNWIILNLCITILFIKVMLEDISILAIRRPAIMLVTFSISMLLTIKQTFELNYKQNLLIKDFERTKSELEIKKQEVEKLEKENLEFSKISHSLAHKQKALEFKLEQLMKTSVDTKSKEIIKQEIHNISKEVYKEPKKTELPKTEIESIDNMFSYMQSECIKYNIKFELQVVGNVFYLINNLISKNELEILIADHIKDAIIAINHSDNTNRSILVRIGKIDNVYSLYIYDSGIEFEKEVIENLGKKPITTHADTGGTGMGFMNTFDTLNRTKASLIINEIGKPCIDNYTKVLIFKFDNKNEFIVNSYKDEVVVV